MSPGRKAPLFLLAAKRRLTAGRGLACPGHCLIALSSLDLCTAFRHPWEPLCYVALIPPAGSSKCGDRVANVPQLGGPGAAKRLLEAPRSATQAISALRLILWFASFVRNEQATDPVRSRPAGAACPRSRVAAASDGAALRSSLRFIWKWYSFYQIAPSRKHVPVPRSIAILRRNRSRNGV